MKKIYATLLMLLVGIMAFAQDKAITIQCDNYEYLNVYAPGSYGGSDDDLLAWNTETKSVQVSFTGDEYSCYMKTKPGYEITEVLDGDGDNLLWGSSDIEWSIYKSQVNDGDVVKVTVKERLPKVAYIKGNPDEVYVEWKQKKYTADDQEDGRWKIAIDDGDYGSIYVYANDGYQLTKVYNSTNERDFLSIPGESAFISIYALEQCDNFIKVTAADLSELRTSKFTLEVDGDLAKVILRRNGSYNNIKLTEGPNEIWFNPATDIPFQLLPENSNSYFYKVTNNGEVVPRSGYMYRLEPENGDEYVVYTEFPENVPVPVSFNFTNENTEDAILKVLVDNKPVEKEVWSSPDFTVNLGSNIGITFNTVYSTEFYVDDVKEYVWGSYSKTVVDETPLKFTITAEKLPVYVLTVNIDDPSHIKLLASGTEMSLNPGENTIELSQGYNYLNITPTPTGVITAITTDPELENPITDFNYVNLYNIKNDMLMTITTEEFVRGNKGIAYLAQGNSTSAIADGNGWDASTLILGSNIPQTQEVDLQTGYNFYDWCEADLPFRYSFFPDPFIYLNDELIEVSYYEGIKDLKENDVLKFYPEEVDPLTATLDIEEGLKATITTDYVNEAAADAEALTVLPGTWVTVAFEKAENMAYIVAVDDIPVEADEDGVYGFTVNEDCMVTIASSPAFPAEFNITADCENVEINQGLDDDTYMIEVSGTSYDENVTLSFERPEGWDGIILINADNMYGSMKKVPSYWPTIDQIKEVMGETAEIQQGLEFTVPADGMHIYMGMLYVGDQVAEGDGYGFWLQTDLSPAVVPAFPEKFDVTLSSEGLTVSQEADGFGGVIINVEGECEADELTVTVATPEGWDGFVGHVFADEPGISPYADQPIFWVAVNDLLDEGMEKTNSLTFAVPDEATAQIGEMFLYIGERADLGRIIELDVNVTKKGSGIEAINADSLINQDVYNLQGILVKAAATAEDLKALPAGLYIVGGKKVVIR